MAGMNICSTELRRLDASTIRIHLREFLCDNAASTTSNDAILFRPDFSPDTFSVLDRINGHVYLTKVEPVGNVWIESMVEAELGRLVEQKALALDSLSNATRFCTVQVMSLLDFEVDGRPVAADLSNQEIPDVIRKVLAYCLTGDPSYELYSHKFFNELAYSIIPILIQDFLLPTNPSGKDLLRYSIASGLIGLDLKGTAAAASGFSISGVPLSSYLHLGPTQMAEQIWIKLRAQAVSSLAVDHWAAFLDEISGQQSQMVWISDDVIESFFDLLLIQELLTNNPSLAVTLVPKNGRHGNDLAFEDVQRFLALSSFSTLSALWSEGRFTAAPHGPTMGTVNLRKLSWEILEAIHRADVVYIKGCRAHELLQGGLNKTSYTAYVVAREFSESESGFDARETPMLFFRCAPGEYAYWGFGGRAKRRKTFPDGREICLCYSTIEDHERRKAAQTPGLILTELSALLELGKELNGSYDKPYAEEAKLLCDKIDAITQASYAAIAVTYTSVRGDEPSTMDIELLDRLLGLARNLARTGKLGTETGTMRLLDVGTGSGRDLRYLTRFGDIQATGMDNCQAFVSILEELERAGKIPDSSAFRMDMRSMDRFGDRTFDIVRHNATLLHLPSVTAGVGMDAALAESHRVLKPYGLLFATLKAGTGMEFVDTGEGLGKRFFQFYSEDELIEALQRNGFEVLDLQLRYEQRTSGTTKWLATYAQKLEKRVVR